MEEKLDKKIYEEYINGNEEAFKILYNKYMRKIQYFIFNIVKDYGKSEDLTQETFLDIVKSKEKIECSFKYYIYLIAKRKSYNYIRINNRRNVIYDKYCIGECDINEDTIINEIEGKESKKMILKSIQKLDKKYRKAIYLIKFEEMSYEETSKILDETVSNTKTLVHRGKKKLRGILIKEGFEKMNKTLKIVLLTLGIGIILSGLVYATKVIIDKKSTSNNVTMNPTYKSTIDEHNINNLWVGTFDIAWQELSSILKRKIVFKEELDIVNSLNSSEFSKNMLDSEDYEINVDTSKLNEIKVEAKLNKNLTFLYPFDNLDNLYKDLTFGNEDEYIKYFGINNASLEEIYNNVEVLFYNSSNDFGVKLKTKETDEIILYRTDDKKNFSEYYSDIIEKNKNYNGDSKFLEGDELFIPYIKLNGIISYDELIGKNIKGTNGYIETAIQDINFNLNNTGCNLSSSATLVDVTCGCIDYMPRNFYFDDTFVVFIKEKSANLPYFALKVDNSDILEKIDIEE